MLMINRPHTTTNEEENVNVTLHIPTMNHAPWGAEKKKKTGKPMQNVFEEPCYKKIVT
jgi:hypothetical protein